ncbi:hypothetical protein OF83DRAFT_1168493 [Amylostereum chailletii]|nr:hypothetical protein OF83DRAFT_1168493 [Amylostereum chailletii]
MPGKRFYDAVIAPFGPYLDHELLSDACKSTPSSVLQLESFALCSGGMVTGLDQTESSYNRNDSEASRATQQRLRPLTVTLHNPLPPDQPVHFRGTLTILHLNHIRPAAKRLLDRELCRRLGRHGQASISELFNENGKFEDKEHPLKIRIQGIKHLPAGYLTSDLVPEGLRITSEDRTRHYDITSMDIETYDLSRTYLSRYRIMADLKESVRGSKVTILRRTPEWFINRYVQVVQDQHPELRWRRMIFDPALKAERPQGNGKPSEKVRDMPLGALSTLPHEVRTVHRAEIRSILGSHVDWIIAQLEATNKSKWLNTDSWKTWANLMKVERRQLQEVDRSTLWARRDEYQGPQPLEDTIEAGSATIQPSQRGRSRPSVRTREPSSRASSSPEPEVDEIDDEAEPLTHEVIEGEPVNEWDSDMSMGSSSSEPDTEPERSPSPPDPDMVSAIPPQIAREPQVPLDFCWVCPIGECRYTVDLLRLTAENTMALRHDMILHREDGSICLDDDNLHLGLRMIVTAHNEEHLASLGIKWVQLPDRAKNHVVDETGRSLL